MAVTGGLVEMGEEEVVRGLEMEEMKEMSPAALFHG